MKIHKALKSWKVKKKQLKQMGINPDKEVGEITLNELSEIAQHLEVTESELLETIY